MDNHILRINGEVFRCECGCNVFHEGKYRGLWICNACGLEYANENFKRGGDE